MRGIGFGEEIPPPKMLSEKIKERLYTSENQPRVSFGKLRSIILAEIWSEIIKIAKKQKVPFEKSDRNGAK